ncbi:MAG: DNA primase [Verrucomicrobiales bacterium]
MGLIPEETIQQIHASTDIVDLVESYFPLKRAGSNFRALCPFHAEKTPSFNVNPARQTYHCFGCGAGGGAIRFVMEYENLDFPTAARKLAERAGITIEEEETDPETIERHRNRNRLIELHREIARWYHHLLFKDAIAAAARCYLKDRGIGMESAREWQLGYAPEASDPLRNWARDHDYHEDLLVAGGILSRPEDNPQRSYSRFRNRLMFPIANDYGDIIAFSGRVLDAEAKAAKYLNSPETILFNKSKTFYGLDKTKRDILSEGRAIVCEGQLDAIACHESGLRNVIAPLGTAFTEQHARLIKRYTQEVVLCFDSDQAGYKAAGRAFGELARVNLVARAVSMPPGQDPDSILKGVDGVATFRALLDDARDFLDFQIDHESAGLDLHSLRDRMQFAQTVAQSVALIGDRMLQDAAIHKVASRLGIPAPEFRLHVMEAAKHATRRGRTRATRGQPSPDTEKSAPIRISNNTVTYLCQLLLTDSEARSWLMNSASVEIFESIPETALLTKIWDAAIDVEEPASVVSFLSTLEPPEETFLSHLLHQPVPASGASAARDAFTKLKRTAIENRIAEKSSLLRRPNLSREDIFSLQKELLDLQGRLTDISPFAAKSD